MALSDLWKGNALRRQLAEQEEHIAKQSKELMELHSVMRRIGAADALRIREIVQEQQAALNTLLSQNEAAASQAKQLTAHIKKQREELLVVEESLLLESFALYTPKFAFTNSAEYKERLSSCRENQKRMIKEGSAAKGSQSFTLDGSETKGKKVVSDMIKLVIRSFNNECDYCVDNVKFDNVERHEARIKKSYDALNKLGTLMQVSINPLYLTHKLDELHLAHEFQIKKQQEKEEAKRAREELREQQKLEQEIRTAREKIEKERKHFLTAIRDLERRLKQTQDEAERQLLLSKLDEVESGRAELDKEERLIDYREKNAKAGYVYVISNIGAFGEGVYKIGMTRRLEPMERIDELGDASVPFWFDVHAMIFSDNAPALEAKLHEHFSSGRLNKINGRKEFFRADISEIEAVIREHYDAAAEVVHEAAAEQYRESLRISSVRETTVI